MCECTFEYIVLCAWHPFALHASDDTQFSSTWSTSSTSTIKCVFQRACKYIYYKFPNRILRPHWIKSRCIARDFAFVYVRHGSDILLYAWIESFFIEWQVGGKGCGVCHIRVKRIVLWQYHNWKRAIKPKKKIALEQTGRRVVFLRYVLTSVKVAHLVLRYR